MSSQGPFDLKLQFATEALFADEILSPALPQAWRIIYYEGMRHNHILFSSDEMRAMEQLLTHGGFTLSESDEDVVLRISSKIFTLADFSSIKVLLSRFTLEQKSVFFLLYKRALRNWALQVKRELH